MARSRLTMPLHRTRTAALLLARAQRLRARFAPVNGGSLGDRREASNSRARFKRVRRHRRISPSWHAVRHAFPGPRNAARSSATRAAGVQRVVRESAGACIVSRTRARGLLVAPSRSIRTFIVKGRGPIDHGRRPTSGCTGREPPGNSFAGAILQRRRFTPVSRETLAADA